jgi:hypothetical protein
MIIFYEIEKFGPNVVQNLYSSLSLQLMQNLLLIQAKQAKFHLIFN